MIRYNKTRDDKAFVAMRPEIPFEIIDTLEIELFQNETLRPILKLQNDILLDYLVKQPNFDSVLKYREKRSVFSERVRIFMQQPMLKSILIGMVLGCFTQEEMKAYHKHSKEMNKRIHQMLLERLVDGLA
jgi:hypothetical protein